MQTEIIRKHSLVIRWTHWVNLPVLAIMMFSGILIYWANDVYTPFIPATFWEQWNLDHRLAAGMAIHFFFMWFFILNGIIYVAYQIWSGGWRELLPDRAAFKNAMLVTLHDLKLRAHLPPQGKFNGGQKLAYTGVALLGLIQVITGFAIYKPVQLQPLLLAMGGYESARLIHFVVTNLLVLFFLVHIAQVARAGWNNFRSMITGTEEITNDEIHRAQGLTRE